MEPDSGLPETSTRGKGYEIKYPSTTHDAGLPSDDLLNDCRRIMNLIDDERHLTAQKLHVSVKERLGEHPGKPVGSSPTKPSLLMRKKALKQQKQNGEDYRIVADFLHTRREKLDTLEKKSAIFSRSLNELNKGDDWILSQTLFGVTTYYRKEADQSLSIKMEGQLDGVPIFEQVAVLKEIDLHQTWAPFCSSSLTVKEIDKLDTVGWFVMGSPHFGLARDGCFRAIGCDNIAEDGNILIYGQGLQDRSKDTPYNEPYLAEGMDDIDVPEMPTKLGSGRMTIRQFTGAIKVLSATSYETKLVANIDPNLPLPQSILDFITRKICGVVINKIQHAAKKAMKDPVLNPHARRIREAQDFYKGWLLPKFEAFCEINNWEMPKVDALELSDEDLEKEFAFNESLARRAKASNIADHFDDESTDTTSRITVGSAGTNFSIKSYLMEMEQRTNEKKARKIAAARQRVAKHLKPKDLTHDQMLRLNELKAAKQRRSRNKGVPDTAIELETIEKKPLKMSMKRSASRFHHHTRSTRFIISTGLFVLLGVVLNPDIITKNLLETLKEHDAIWWSEILLDVGTCIYIAVCAVIHFILCDVSMVYAFGALDLGMKTGKQSKQYYDTKVRVPVALMSGSIAVLSIFQAILMLSWRAIIWRFMQLSELLAALISRAYDLLCTFIPSTMMSHPSDAHSAVMGIVVSGGNGITRAVSALVKLLYTVFIQSNRIGQLIGVLGGFTWSCVLSLHTGVVDYMGNIRGIYQENEIVPTWRGVAIETMRLLYAYTAVFLISILVLFNASSRANKKKIEKWQNLSSVSMEDDASFRRNPLSRDDSALNSQTISARSTEESSAGDCSVSVCNISSRSKQVRFKLRLRRKDRLDDSTPNPSQFPATAVVVH